MDLQQRSCEFLELLGSDWDSHRPGILDRMPVPDKEGMMMDTDDSWEKICMR